MGYVIRVSLLLALCVASLLALLDWSSQRANDLLEATARRAHAAIVVFEVRQEIVAAIEHKGVLKHAQSIGTILERIRAQNDRVLSIDVFDRAGRILFSTNPRAAGEFVPAAWLSDNAAEELHEFTNLNDPAYLGRIAAGLGEGAGIVVTMRSPTSIDVGTDHVGGLLEKILLIIAAAIIAGLVGIPIGRQLIAPAKDAVHVLHGAPLPKRAGPLAQLSETVWHMWKRSEDRAAEQMKRLKELDDVA